LGEEWKRKKKLRRRQKEEKEEGGKGFDTESEGEEKEDNFGAGRRGGVECVLCGSGFRI